MPEPYAVRIQSDGTRTSYRNRASYLSGRASLIGGAQRRARR